ncbi:MAG: hypothetical protein RUMPE_00276 [Eubacteriales bacterium SKADARSKE-1]|nr:hypothetical protein [Eubacteriales bacterium SKADARSKE-1]
MKREENTDEFKKNIDCNDELKSKEQNEPLPQKKRKVIAKVLLILFLVALFAYLCFSDNGLIEFLQNPSKIDIGWLIMAFFCQIINIAIDAILVYKFINTDKKIKLSQSITCSLIGQFFSAITPSATGGQPMQVYAMSKRGIAAGTTTSALTQKFVVFQTSLIGYCILAILLRIDYFNSLNKIVYSLLIIGFLSQALIALGLIIVSFNKKITNKFISIIINFFKKFKIFKKHEEKIEKFQQQVEIFYQGNQRLYKNKYLVLETYVLTAIQLTATFIIPYCVYRSFGFSGERASDMISAQAFITMAASLFPVPGASGATEGASSIFLSPFFDETSIKSAVVLTRLITYYFTIIISAPISLWWRRAAKKVSN